VTRAKVGWLLAASDEQLGSVNEPRVFEEPGCSGNEKWLYRDAAGRVELGGVSDRCDLVGLFRIDAGGSWQRAPLPEA
jgi:hypothetical protein